MGLSTLTDTVGKDRLGTAMGSMTSVTIIGVLSGPAVAGALLQLVGYWPTWCVPLSILAVDFIARTTMIESPDRLSSPPPTTATDTMNVTYTQPQSDEETTALLPSDDKRDSNATTVGFYCIMLTDVQVWAALIPTVLVASISSGFNTTLPLHLHDIFHWGSLPVGLVFLSLQVPIVFFGPISGRLRDRIGVRWPSVISWFLLCPLLVLLGIPGNAAFPWALADTHGKAIFITTIVGVGSTQSFVRGAGSFQLIGM